MAVTPRRRQTGTLYRRAALRKHPTARPAASQTDRARRPRTRPAGTPRDHRPTERPIGTIARAVPSLGRRGGKLFPDAGSRLNTARPHGSDMPADRSAQSIVVLGAGGARLPR